MIFYNFHGTKILIATSNNSLTVLMIKATVSKRLEG